MRYNKDERCYLFDNGDHYMEGWGVSIDPRLSVKIDFGEYSVNLREYFEGNNLTVSEAMELADFMMQLWYEFKIKYAIEHGVKK
jgi:hypothetical protein